MDFRFNLLKSTIIGWSLLMAATILIMWQRLGFNNSEFNTIYYLFYALGLFYTVLLFNTQRFKRSLIKTDNAVEVGGTLSIIFNVILLLSFVIIVLSIFLQEPSLLRGPMFLLVAHTYLEGNSVIVGDKYISIGFTLFEKSLLSSYEVIDKKHNKSIVKVKLTNNKEISVTRSKFEIQEFSKLLNQSLNKPSA